MIQVPDKKSNKSQSCHRRWRISLPRLTSNAHCIGFRSIGICLFLTLYVIAQVQANELEYELFRDSHYDALSNCTRDCNCRSDWYPQRCHIAIVCWNIDSNGEAVINDFLGTVIPDVLMREDVLTARNCSDPYEISTSIYLNKVMFSKNALLPKFLNSFVMCGNDTGWNINKTLFDDIITDVEDVSDVKWNVTNDIAPCIKITHIYMRYCNIYAVHANAFYNMPLTVLDLRSNSIGRIRKGAFDTLTSLQHLDIAENPLNSLGSNLFSELVNLETLDLSNTDINSTVMGFTSSDPLYHVKKLKWQNTPVHTLPGKIMRIFPHLQSLNVSHGQLQGVDPFALSEMKSMTVVSLAHNRLRTLPEGVFSGSPIQELYLSRNLWECNCELEWLRIMVQNLGESNTDNPACINPPALRFRPFNSIKTFCFTSTAVTTNVTATSTDDGKLGITSGNTVTPTTYTVPDGTVNTSTTTEDSTVASNSTSSTVWPTTTSSISVSATLADLVSSTVSSTTSLPYSFRCCIPDSSTIEKCLEGGDYGSVSPTKESSTSTLTSIDFSIAATETTFVVTAEPGSYETLLLISENEKPLCWTRLYNLTSAITIVGLQSSTTYAICASQSASPQLVMSLKNCKMRKTDTPVSDQLWLSEAARPYVMAAIPIAFLLACGIGALIVWCVKRKRQGRRGKEIFSLDSKIGPPYLRMSNADIPSQYARPPLPPPRPIDYEHLYDDTDRNWWIQRNSILRASTVSHASSTSYVTIVEPGPVVNKVVCEETLAEKLPSGPTKSLPLSLSESQNLDALMQQGRYGTL